MDVKTNEDYIRDCSTKISSALISVQEKAELERRRELYHMQSGEIERNFEAKLDECKENIRRVKKELSKFWFRLL